MRPWRFLWLCGMAIFFVATSPAIASEVAEKLMVLNFDDGPELAQLYGYGGRPGLIDILGKHNVPAHFFPMGWKVVSHPGIAGRLAAKGYLYENHTYGHDNLKERRKKFSSDKKFLETVLRARRAVIKETGRAPKYLRPPYWAVTPEIRELLRAAGYTVMELGHPDVNTLDWDDQANHRPAPVLVARVKSEVARREKRGEYRHVLVFHELLLTAEALDELIPYFKARGYRFGTLDEYFAKNPTAKN